MTSTEALQVLRVVLDTNVAVSGLLSTQGAAHALVDLAVHHRTWLRLGASEENRAELLATLRESRLMDRHFKRYFSDHPTGAQPREFPLRYPGGEVTRRLHPAPSLGGYPRSVGE